MPNEHAKIVRPSSMDRTLHCPPSALINAQAPPKETAYTLEGTCAHSVCEYLLRTAIGEDPPDPREDLDYYDENMLYCAEAYRDFCMEQLADAGDDAHLLVEQRVDVSAWAPGCFGTADCIIISDKVLHLIDFKFGTGVLVSAQENAQLMTYGLGAIAMLGVLYDFEEVKLSIFQPRRSSVDTYVTTRTTLLDWGDEVLKPAAAEALAGTGSYHCGAWCRFCAISGECREQARAMALDYVDPPTLSPEEIAELLPKLDVVKAWIADVQGLALSRALEGTKYPGSGFTAAALAAGAKVAYGAELQIIIDAATDKDLDEIKINGVKQSIDDVDQFVFDSYMNKDYTITVKVKDEVAQATLTFTPYQNGVITVKGEEQAFVAGTPVSIDVDKGTPVQYTVVFDNNGGTVSASVPAYETWQKTVWYNDTKQSEVRTNVYSITPTNDTEAITLGVDSVTFTPTITDNGNLGSTALKAAWGAVAGKADAGEKALTSANAVGFQRMQT